MLVAAAGLCAGAQAQASDFPPVIRLADLDGTQGFRLDGVAAGDNTGLSVSGAGDVNGDGIDDFVIGAPYGSPDFASAGITYVVFGRRTGFPAALDLSILNGTNGFRVDGIRTEDLSGFSLGAAGDVNGDGVGDIILSAVLADPGGRGYAGESYVVFGRRTGFPPSIGLINLNGSDGFRPEGIDVADWSGCSVSGAGDVNGDGIGDVIVGARYGDPRAREYAGESYVVFGRRSGFPASLILSSLDGTSGFRIDGADPQDFSGTSVAGAGDVNGDGIDDVVVGARYGDPGGRFNAGEAYVVFGRRGVFPATLDLAGLDGTAGFRLDGIGVQDFVGRAVASAGDVNGDGVGDVFVGANGADPAGRINAGEGYVVFGRRTGFPPSIPLSGLNGATGFRLVGIREFDSCGQSVASAGDVNGDGIGDLVIGADDADPSGRSRAGQSFVVFGRRTGFPSAIELSSLDGTSGFRIDGIDVLDYSGFDVASAGDVNGDGVDDVIIGARYADPNGFSKAGEAYVVFGRGRACAADVNGDGVVDSDDFFDFLNAFNRADAGADFNGDGVVDSDDFFDFLNAFNTGC